MLANRRVRGILGTSIASAALILGGLGVAATPALAANTLTGPASAAPNQQVAYTLTVTQASPFTGNNQLTLADCLTGQQLGNNVYYVTGMGGLGSWTFAFITPPSAATMQPCVLMDGSPLPGAVTNLTVGGVVSTFTVVTAPDTAKLGVATKILVTVQSASPSQYNPTGQVVVKDINGATLQTMGLTAGPGTGQSYAYYWWTPTVAGQFTFQGFYNGDSFAQRSQSSVDTVIATASGSPISLVLPPTLQVGVPVTLQANVYPTTLQGSVGFTLNGAPITGSIAIVNGVAKTTWTPTAPGTVTMGANYMTNQGGSGSTSQQVTIIAAPASPDVITLSQPGFGAWAPNGNYTLANGTSFAFQAQALSGQPVTLRNNGACTTTGLTLNIVTGSGTCTLTATTPGGNGYSPASQNYTVTQVPGQQTAVVAAPLSGRLKAGRTYQLESAGQGDTNAGQNITWSITKGKGTICSLQFASNGVVNLRLKKKGTCNVRGQAPGVPNMWQPYKIVRNYVGR